MQIIPVADSRAIRAIAAMIAVCAVDAIRTVGAIGAAFHVAAMIDTNAACTCTTSQLAVSIK